MYLGLCKGTNHSGRFNNPPVYPFVSYYYFLFKEIKSANLNGLELLQLCANLQKCIVTHAYHSIFTPILPLKKRKIFFGNERPFFELLEGPNLPFPKTLQFLAEA